MIVMTTKVLLMKKAANNSLTPTNIVVLMDITKMRSQLPQMMKKMKRKMIQMRMNMRQVIIPVWMIQKEMMKIIYLHLMMIKIEMLQSVMNLLFQVMKVKQMRIM